MSTIQLTGHPPRANDSNINSPDLPEQIVAQPYFDEDEVIYSNSDDDEDDDEDILMNKS